MCEEMCVCVSESVGENVCVRESVCVKGAFKMLSGEEQPVWIERKA